MLTQIILRSRTYISTLNFQEEEGITNEELQKKIDKLGKQQETMTKKSFDIGHKLRALELGQDRYRRR